MYMCMCMCVCVCVCVCVGVEGGGDLLYYTKINIQVEIDGQINDEK